MSHDFYADAWNKSIRRNRVWYQTNLMPALLAAKERQVREIDASIALANELIEVFNIFFIQYSVYNFTVLSILIKQIKLKFIWTSKFCKPLI